jgi:dolichol-phosphate mannosyltransferase
MKEDIRYYFLIPVYNEEANIALLADDLSRFADDLSPFIVFIDDASTDRTCAEISRLFPSERCQIVKKAQRAGAGDSFNNGFLFLQNRLRSQDVVVMMEGDGTSDLSILAQLLEALHNGSDVALASVYAKGGGFDQTTWLRKSISACANILMRWRFGLKAKTVSSFYRALKGELVLQMMARFNPLITEKGYTSMIELLIKAGRCKAIITEVPMQLHSKRRKGKSKMSIVPVALDYLKLLLKRY